VVKSRLPLVRFALVVLAISVVGAVRGQEQEPARPEQELTDAEVKFWTEAATGPFAATAQLVLARDPFMIAAMRAKGLDNFVWRELGFVVGDTAPALDKKLLNEVRDGKLFPRISDLPEKEQPPDVKATYQLFNQMLVNSFEAPLDSFKKSGEEYKNVTIAHLMQAPNRYRGEVIRIQGRLYRLREYDATELARKHNVTKMYEAWIFGPTPGANPFCVFFPMLPAGLEPGEKMDRKVTFYGYFLTNFKYDAGEGLGRRETPLLVGPTLIVGDSEKAVAFVEETPFSFEVLLFVLGSLVVITIAVFLIQAWFRAGDDNIEDTIRGIKDKNRPVPFADEQQSVITPEDLARIPQAFPVPGGPANGNGAPANGTHHGSERPNPDPERN